MKIFFFQYLLQTKKTTLRLTYSSTHMYVRMKWFCLVCEGMRLKKLSKNLSAVRSGWRKKTGEEHLNGFRFF